MAASAGGRCPGYTPNKAACCFHVCPAAHSGSSSTPKGRFSPTQASQESVSQPANTGARAGCRKASQTLPAETSSPKSNSTEKGEVTKGSLETLRTLAVEKEQPCSTSSGCQWDRTGQCFPRVPGAARDRQGKHCGHWARDGGAGVREHSAGEVTKHIHPCGLMLQGALIQHIPSLCTPFLCSYCPHVHFIILVFTYLGCCNPVTSFSKWQPTPGGTGSRISVRRCSVSMGSSPQTFTGHVCSTLPNPLPWHTYNGPFLSTGC